MAIATRPSKITLPSNNEGCSNLLDFLIFKFPLIEASTWVSRFKQGKIHWLSGEIVDANTPYQAGQILCYYREVEEEPNIHFKHEIIFQKRSYLSVNKII